MVESSDIPAPEDGGAPPAPEAPSEVPAQDDDFAYLDKSQEELMDAIPEETPPVEKPPAEPPPVEVPPVAEPPPPVVPPVEEPPVEVSPVAPPLTPAVEPPSMEEQNKQLKAQLAAIQDQMNRMVGLDKVGAFDPPQPVPGIPPLDPAVPPSAPGVYTPPAAQLPPPAAGVPIVTPMVNVAAEVLPEGFRELAEPLTRITQNLTDQIYGDIDAKIDQKLNSLVQSSRYVAGVNKRFYESYPALAPYKELVGQIAAPYEAHIISAPQQGLDASVYFAPIAQRATAYLTSQGITVDPTQAPSAVPGLPATPPPVNPAAARATAPTGAARTGAAVPGQMTQHDYMGMLS